MGSTRPTRQEELEELVAALNADEAVDGILVQLPLPDHLDPERIVRMIDPAKDVDGLTPVNAGLLAHGTPGLVSCTPAGVMELLAHEGVEGRRRPRRGGRPLEAGRRAGRPPSPARERDGDDVPLAHP